MAAFSQFTVPHCAHVFMCVSTLPIPWTGLAGSPELLVMDAGITAALRQDQEGTGMQRAGTPGHLQAQLLPQGALQLMYPCSTGHPAINTFTEQPGNAGNR